MMKSTVSTHVMNNVHFHTIDRAQNDIRKTHYEVVNRRVRDIGYALGRKVSRYLNLENQADSLNGLKQTNSLAMHQMDVIQRVMKELHSAGEADNMKGLLNTFSAALLLHGDQQSFTTLQTTSRSVLAAFVLALNTSHNGVYVFGGTNTREAPLNHYEAGSNKGASHAVRQAFQDYFGFPPDDPQAATITPDSMKAFIDGPFSRLFEKPEWNRHFCKATDGAVSNCICLNGETVNISKSANETCFCQAMKSLVLVAEFAGSRFSGGAAKVLCDEALALATGAQKGITDAAAEVGRSQVRMQEADKRIGIQMHLLADERIQLIGVDRTAAGVHLKELQTTLESAYTLTVWMSRLNLIRYLK